MDGAAASTSKSICGWTWHSALNIIPPWSTLFLHVYLVTAVTDWEGRVYPAAAGIALLTHDFQLHTIRASRNACNQFIMKKKLEWLVHDPDFGFLVFQPYKRLVDNSGAPPLGIFTQWCEGTIFTCLWYREWALGKGVYGQGCPALWCYWWQGCSLGVLGRRMQVRST